MMSTKWRVSKHASMQVREQGQLRGCEVYKKSSKYNPPFLLQIFKMGLDTQATGFSHSAFN